MQARSCARGAAVILGGTLLLACSGPGAAAPPRTPLAAGQTAQPAVTTGPPADTGTRTPEPPGGRGTHTDAQGKPSPAGRPTDTIEVTKCYTNATKTAGGQMLISARSSDRSAHLTAYSPDGRLIGEVQNGGGNRRYGGTVIAYQPQDPVTVTIRSSAGGSLTVPTTPFQPEN